MTFFSCYFTFDFFEKDISSHLFSVSLYVLSPDLLGMKNTAVALFYMINGTDIIVFSLVFMYWRSADILMVENLQLLLCIKQPSSGLLLKRQRQQKSLA